MLQNSKENASYHLGHAIICEQPFVPSKKEKRLAYISALGTAIEFYDFTLFGVFTPIIASVFFPGYELKLTLILFASSFLMRPFGAIIFGFIGDKWGRKPALALSIFCMSIPTFIIGILPSYASIGIAAPIMLALCRLSQGIFAGGEHNGAAIYVAEHWPKSAKGLASSVVVSGLFLGIFAAVVSGILATNLFPASFAWRIPFLLGIVAGIIGFYIRLKLSETPEFKTSSQASVKNTYEQNVLKQRAPLRLVVTENTAALFKTLSISGFIGVVGYIIAVYINIHLNTRLGIPFNVSITLTAICMFSAFVSCILTGKISDKLGSTFIMQLATGLFILLAYPIFIAINTGDVHYIVLANIVLGALTGMVTSPLHAVINPLFPVERRYTGTALGYSLGLSLFGGTTPYIASILIDQLQSNDSPAIYIIFTALLCFFALNLKQSD